MKNVVNLLLGTASLVLCLIVAERGWALPFHDPFDYPDGSGLSEQLNPEGNAWGVCNTNASVASGPDVTVTNINLNYPGLSYSSNYAVYFGGWADSTSPFTGYSERIAINPPIGGTTPFAINNGTIYYSFVLMVENLAGADTLGAFACGFNNTTGPQGGSVGTVCGRLFLRVDPANTSNGYQVGVGKQAATRTDATYATNQFLVGETNFVVVSYTAIGANSTDDYAQLWVNPNPSTFGAVIPPPPDATNAVGNDFGTVSASEIQSFLLRQGNGLIPMIIADELRIGPTWACVTPPTNAPPPTAVNLDIALSGTNAVISWPTNAACFALQSTPTLSDSNDWTTVYGAFEIVGDQFTITNALNGQSLFYRLRSF